MFFSSLFVINNLFITKQLRYLDESCYTNDFFSVITVELFTCAEKNVIIAIIIPLDAVAAEVSAAVALQCLAEHVIGVRVTAVV